MQTVFKLLAGAVLALSIAVPAFAHTTLTKSTPAKDATVAAPSAVVLEFGADVKLARVQVVTPAGEAITLPLDRGAAPSKQMTMNVPKQLGAGNHTVKWRAIAPDGHVMTGDFTFSVK